MVLKAKRRRWRTGAGVFVIADLDELRGRNRDAARALEFGRG